MTHSIEKRLGKGGLCHGCGTCAGCCPQTAIQMKIVGHVFAPEVDVSLCRECGLCLEVCPMRTDLDAINKFVFGRSIEDVELGNFIHCYIGHSEDPQTRWNASSGGLITTLLNLALEKGIIDGAVVTRMNQKRPLMPEVTIAKSTNEITRSSRSKYCPVCVNQKLGEVLKNEGRYALVGLPCHIQGIRTAENTLKEVRDRIYLHFGLFCLHNITFYGSHFMLEKLRIRREDVKSLSYRGQGWPGRISVALTNGSERSFSYPHIWSALFGTFFFTPAACMVCSDMTSELADISFGDAWLPEFRNTRRGISMIITRTERGEDLLKEARKARKIRIEEIGRERVVEAHKLGIYFKKKNLSERLRFLLHFDGEIASRRGMKLIDPGLIDRLLAPLSLLNVRISSEQDLANLLEYVPLSLMRRYTTVFNFLRRLAI